MKKGNKKKKSSNEVVCKMKNIPRMLKKNMLNVLAVSRSMKCNVEHNGPVFC